ncbi:hypothetical protein DSO57_1034060 [Entomophthora muscae]|uniref:Uncharacterized protein n=1 Tax=Entomophthora muscae TaxID=34485 RepID=A0ACC2SCL6_9FUNG|nr:hypothetical protein DSO57_1034060 [Entomophthora muscae]
MTLEVNNTELQSYNYDWFDISLQDSKPVECTAGFGLNVSDPVESLHQHNFFKLAKWSPDGSAIASSAQDRKLRIFFVPPAATSQIYGQNRGIYLFEKIPDSSFIFCRENILKLFCIVVKIFPGRS